MKRLLTVLLCLLMLTPLVTLLPFNAAAETTTKFTVADKNGNATTTFVYGEPIMITPLTADGSGSWIGIAPKGKVGYGSYRSKMITKDAKDSSQRVASAGLGVNVAFDLRTGAAVESRFYNATSIYNADIGPGEWTIFYVASGYARDYDTTSTVDITVTEGPMTVNKTEFYVGEPILVTAKAQENTTYKSWYGIVPDANGSPKYSYGTIIYRDADGTEDDLRDTASDAGSTGTIKNAKLRANCASWLGVSEKMLLGLPAGTWWLIYCEDSSTVNGGKAVTHKIQIKIKPAFTTDKTAYAYGEPINVTVSGGMEKGDHIFIAPKHEDNEKSYYSIRWQTLSSSNTTFDIRSSGTSGNYPHLWQLPPGDYSIYAVFAPNSKAYQNDHATRINITISGEAPKAPTAAVYDFDKTTGLAGGTLTVTLDEAEVNNTYGKPTHIITYWGDENGQKLADYTYIGLRDVAGVTTVIDIPAATVIPDEARTLLVHAYNGAGVSAQCVTVTLPTDRRIVNDEDKGALLSSFQIVSDIHTQDAQTNQFNVNIARMLADIKANDPNSAGIFVSGDAVNDGRVAEYENLYALWVESGLSAPIFMATGNHEWKLGDADNSYTSNYEEEKDRFIQYTNQFLTASGRENIENGLPYYDLWVNGFHYIFLASEAPITHAYLSDTQLEWLDRMLAEDRDANRPTFILLHQALYNTIDGGMPRQDWDGVIAGDAAYDAWKASGVWKTRGQYEQGLRDILKKYPEAMMFSGHSHWDMTEYHNYYDPTDPTDPDDALPNYLFNTAAVAYLCTGYYDDGVSYAFGKGWYAQTYTLYGETHLKWDDSKGYYVRIYENCIEIYGREFSSSQWVPNAMYRIALNDVEPHTHTSEYLCSTVCKTCGTAITAERPHESDHACDATCKHCGQELVLTTADHSYDNACDTACNACNDIREVEDHQYDNACDANCNECGALREVGEHVQKFECSVACDICSKPFDTFKPHTGEKICSEFCIYCEQCVVEHAEGISHTHGLMCSDRCSVCEERIEPQAPHENTSTCADACMYCGQDFDLSTTDHQRGSLCSTACSVCHEPMEKIAEHQRLYPCSELCRYCEQYVIPDPAKHDRGPDCSTICQVCNTELPAYKDHENLYTCSRICKYCALPLAATPTAEHEKARECSDTCKNCNESIPVLVNHERLYPCSEICKYCEEAVIPDPDEHDRGLDCSTTCVDCKATLPRYKDHEGEFDCSRICKYCEEAVISDATAAQHKRQYNCSTSCRVCNESIPSASPHEQLSECSDLCKHCRMPMFMGNGNHKGEFECSDTCKSCGATIVLLEDHESAHDCSKICKYCNQSVVLPRGQHAGSYACSTTCAACGAPVAPGEHTYGAWQPHVTAQHKKQCECGAAIYADHTWDEGSVTTEPTTEAKGERTFTCTDCKTTRTEEIAQLPTASDDGNGNTTTNNADAGQNRTDTGNGDGLGAGAIVAIVLGGVAVVGGGGFATYWFVFRKKKKG